MNTQNVAPEWIQLLQAQPVLVLSLLAAVVLFAGVLVWAQRNYAVRREAPLQTVTPELQRLVTAQASALKLMGERVAALENYLELVGDKQQLMAQSRKPKLAYRDAINGADGGASGEEIMQRFGLARPEAALVAAIYGGKNQPATTH